MKRGAFRTALFLVLGLAAGCRSALAQPCSPVPGDRPDTACAQRVVLGDERTEVYLPLLAGKRVALYSNASGIVGDVILDADGRPVSRRQTVTQETALTPFPLPGTVRFGPHILDVLLAQGVDVTAIFSPEHGFRGTADAGEHVPSGVDPATGVPILSLYERGDGHPSAASMDRFDVLVVDIQDVGLRYYTYYITMHHLMEACAQCGKPVVVLDRPNPNGFYVDGPILDVERLRSGVGWLPVPVVHGMTLGELARMIVGEGWLEADRPCDLTVVPCLGYTHQTRYALAMPPSPNLKDMQAIYLYSSTCFFEGTQVTAGRGTPWPFTIYGHPGLTDYPFSFTPASMPGAKSPRYMGQVCRGRDLRGLPLETVWAAGINLEYVVDAFTALNRPEGGTGPVGAAFFMKNGHFDRLAGVTWVREMILGGASAPEIKARWQGDVAAFRQRRRPYLLYEE